MRLLYRAVGWIRGRGVHQIMNDEYEPLCIADPHYYDILAATPSGGAYQLGQPPAPVWDYCARGSAGIGVRERSHCR